MSTLIILISGLVSLAVGYFVAHPFLATIDIDVNDIDGDYPEYFNDSRSDSYRDALDSLDYAFQSGIISGEEFESQKVLLLKDAAKFVSKKN